MLPSYFDYIFVHLKQKARLRPELSPKFLSTLGPNPALTWPEKPAPTYNSALNVAKAQCKLRVASGFNLLWFRSMEWNMEEKFSMKWRMESNMFSMEWKWNGRKMPVWNMLKLSSIPYHALAMATRNHIRVVFGQRLRLGCSTLLFVNHKYP